MNLSTTSPQASHGMQFPTVLHGFMPSDPPPDTMLRHGVAQLSEDINGSWYLNAIQAAHPPGAGPDAYDDDAASSALICMPDNLVGSS
jgi:hypothetical protein